jgi:hypothetical protein
LMLRNRLSYSTPCGLCSLRHQLTINALHILVFGGSDILSRLLSGSYLGFEINHKKLRHI